MITPTAIRIADCQELHMFGDTVAVVWTVKHTKLGIQEMRDGILWTATTTKAERTNAAPYIELVNLKQTSSGAWRNDDIPELSLSFDAATELLGELTLAVQYLEEHIDGTRSPAR